MSKIAKLFIFVKLYFRFDNSSVSKLKNLSQFFSFSWRFDFSQDFVNKLTQRLKLLKTRIESTPVAPSSQIA